MRFRTALLLALVVVACGKDAKSTEPASGDVAKPTTAAKVENYQPVNGLDLEAEVPPGATPNGSVPGFQNADKTFKFVMRAIGSTPDYADAAALRAATPSAKEWLEEKTLADGWYVTHTMDKIEMVEEGGGLKSKVVGDEFSMMMRRKIGDSWYTCTSILPRKELLDAVIKTCKSVRKPAA